MNAVDWAKELLDVESKLGSALITMRVGRREARLVAEKLLEAVKVIEGYRGLFRHHEYGGSARDFLVSIEDEK